jgi:hypothetical protein
LAITLESANSRIDVENRNRFWTGVKTYETEKGEKMNEGTRNQLETKLKKMLNHLDQAKAKQQQPIRQSGTGNIIRRRAGEKERRFSI